MDVGMSMTEAQALAQRVHSATHHQVSVEADGAYFAVVVTKLSGDSWTIRDEQDWAWMQSRIVCSCAALPERFEDANVQAVIEVAANVDVDSAVEDSTSISYRCLDCGQWWRDGFRDDHALRKVPAPH